MGRGKSVSCYLVERDLRLLVSARTLHRPHHAKQITPQLVLAGDMDGGLDDRGQHATSVLVHRVRDWTERTAKRAGGNSHGGGEGGGGDSSHVHPGVPPLTGGPQERFVDQRRYANVSRCVLCSIALRACFFHPVR